MKKDLDVSISKVESELVAAKAEGNHQKIISLKNILKALMRLKGKK